MPRNTKRYADKTSQKNGQVDYKKKYGAPFDIFATLSKTLYTLAKRLITKISKIKVSFKLHYPHFFADT